MYGPKTSCTLQRLTTARSGRHVTPTYTTVKTFNGVLAPLKAEENKRYEKETVVATHRLMVDYSAIGAANAAYVTETSQIVAGGNTYDITGVWNGHDRHYEIDLKLIS
jgi:hypothetical protein